MFETQLIRPSLLLDFVNSQSVDPRITFTRASTATYYDGKTFAKAEENLLKYSQDFDNSAWVKSNATVTANTGAAPDGTMTADTLTASGANGSALQTFTATAQPYTFSLWVRRTVGTGTVEITADGTTWSAITISGTWTRFSVTVTPSAGSRTAGIRLATSGDAVEIWGAQLEQRSTVTAYTPTTDQPITRYQPQLMTAAANEPRIDFDHVTGECKGLLIEEQRTNLLKYSEQFDNAAWVKTNVSIASNVAVAPDGTISADKLVEDTSNGTHFVVPASPISKSANATSFTFSIYAKAAERSSVQIRIADASASANCVICDANLATQTVTTSSGGTFTRPSATITAVGNGWFRVALTGTTGTETSIFALVFLTNPSGTNSYTGDGTSGIYIWGAQLEAGAFATSYIPTNGSQVTRAADSAIMTGANFSSWYRQDEGTLFADASVDAFSKNSVKEHQALFVQDSIVANTFNLRAYSDGAGKLFVDASSRANNVTVADFWGLNYGTSPVSFREALSYDANSFSFSANGSIEVDSTISLPVGIDRMVIGATNIHIRRIAYWPKRLPNETLQVLTKD